MSILNSGILIHLFSLTCERHMSNCLIVIWTYNFLPSCNRKKFLIGWHEHLSTTRLKRDEGGKEREGFCRHCNVFRLNCFSNKIIHISYLTIQYFFYKIQNSPKVADFLLLLYYENFYIFFRNKLLQ